MKTIFFIFLFLFLISFTTAINIEAGDSYKIDLGEIPAYYEVTNNFDVEVTYNGTIVSITPGKYMEGDFTITFYNEKDESIISSSGSSGNHPKDRGCITNWQCTEFGSCINSIRTRECSKIISYCGVKQDKPSEKESCEMLKEDDSEIVIPEDKENNNLRNIIIGVAIIIIVFVVIMVIEKRK